VPDVSHCCSGRVRGHIYLIAGKAGPLQRGTAEKRKEFTMADNESIVETPVAEETEQFDIEVEELDTVSGGLAVSSLACAACPVSSFSSVSN
jgi:hypothetical protein